MPTHTLRAAVSQGVVSVVGWIPQLPHPVGGIMLWYSLVEGARSSPRISQFLSRIKPLSCGGDQRDRVPFIGHLLLPGFLTLPTSTACI